MCRFIEPWTGEPRPKNKTPQQVIQTMIDDETFRVFSKIASIATTYFIERLAAGCSVAITKDAPRL
jgi:hypothetical protein